MNKTFPDQLVFHYLIRKMANPTIVFPFFIWILSTWRVSRLRHFSYSDYQDRLNESVVDMVKEQISHTFLDPCFTYENFYQFFFYSSKLILISVEITALALSYHLYNGVRHLLMDFSGFIFLRIGRKRLK